MKLLIMLVLALFTCNLYAATYHCTEIYDPFYEVLKVRTTVTIEELKEIVSSESHDYSYQVKVSITETLGSEITSQKELVSIASVTDVYYTIEDSQEGVSVYMYLDEEDEAGITYLTLGGTQKKVRLSCFYQE